MQTQTVHTQETQSQLLITKTTDGTFSNTPVTNRDVMTTQTLNAQKTFSQENNTVVTMHTQLLNTNKPYSKSSDKLSRYTMPFTYFNNQNITSTRVFVTTDVQHGPTTLSDASPINGGDVTDRGITLLTLDFIF
jgi:hypothetical protein